MYRQNPAIMRLRAAYWASLPRKLDSIEVHCLAARSTAESLIQAVREVGQVKGTAGTIGFPDVAEVMSRLEAALIAYSTGERSWTEIEEALATARITVTSPRSKRRS
ncbi:MAG: Hpt domain-containing protein [Myxococcales bacterium]|nr:Hpt domain-containing protein [Myxococcales bacterium]